MSDPEYSVVFYRGLLGLDLVHVQDQGNDYILRLVGYPDGVARVAQFAAPGQPRGHSTHDRELVEYLTPRLRGRSVKTAHPGAAYLAITVDDVHALVARLAAAGGHLVSGPNRITEGFN